MAGPLDLRGRVVITDGATGVLNKVRNGLQTIGRETRRVTSSGPRAGAITGAVSTAAMYQLVQSTREFNESLWGAQAAFLGNVKAKTAEEMTEGVNKTRDEAERLRKTALDLSKSLGLMPETFMKAGEEAAKMGLNLQKSEAVMKASGLIQMSDRESQANVMAKALGTYGIIYGAEEDDEKYAQQVKQRASMLALAGAQTRTSASKIEEGMRNYMGIHGAFGGRFEDAVALIAMGSQIGQQEKESGTALKSIQARFLNMPVGGRGALAAAGIDMSKFMDFGGVDPARATNQLIQMFPQQLGKGARGNLLKWMEQQRASGGMNDPSIINKTLQRMEKLGLKFAGDQDRENAANKIAAVMSGVGGKFDPLALISEIDKAIKEGRAGPGIWAAIGEPKRLHQYAGLMRIVNDTLKLRNGLLEDGGRYLDLVSRGYAVSDAGKIVALEAAFRRLQITLMRSDGVQSALDMFNRLATWFESLPPAVANATGSLMAIGGIAGVAGLAIAGIVAGFSALASTAGLVVVGLTALGAGLVWAWNNTEKLKELWSQMASAMQEWAGNIADGALDMLATGIERVQTAWASFASWVSGWADSIMGRIRAFVDGVAGMWARLRGLFSSIPMPSFGGGAAAPPADGSVQPQSAPAPTGGRATGLLQEASRFNGGAPANDNGGNRFAELSISINDSRTTAKFNESGDGKPMFGRVNLNTGPTMSGAR